MVKKRTAKQILGLIWELFPLAWSINLFARIGIASATISYLDLTGELSIFLNIILIIWMFMPLRALTRDLYYNWRETYYNWEINKK